MRIINTPEPVEWETGVPKDGVIVKTMKMTDFREFCLDAIRLTPEFGKGIENVAIYLKIRKAVRSITMETREIRLEDTEWKALKKAIEELSWSPEYAAACMEGGYFKAITEAQEVDIATKK